MLRKILFVLQKKIFSDGVPVDILNHRQLKDLERNISYENLEKHNEDLLLMDVVDDIITPFRILLYLYFFYLLPLLLIFLLEHNIF